MKKALSLILVSLLTATVIFSDIRVSGWGRSIFSPIAYDGNKENSDDALVTFGGNSWSGTQSRLGFGLDAQSKNRIGFHMGITVNADKTTDLEGYMWAKPWRNLQVSLGNVTDATLVTHAYYNGAVDWIRSSGPHAYKISAAGNLGGSIVFKPICIGWDPYDNWAIDADDGLAGMILAFEPIGGLYITAGIPVDPRHTKAGNGSYYAGDQEIRPLRNMVKLIQGAVGYTIDGIGTVKFGWWGLGKETPSAKGEGYYAITNIAFDLTAIPDFALSVGCEYSPDIYGEGFFTANVEQSHQTLHPSFYAKYSGIPQITLHSLGDFRIGMGDDKDKTDATIGIAMQYALPQWMTLTADLRYVLDTCGAYPDRSKHGGTLLLGIERSFTNGSLGIGLQGSLGNVDDLYFGMTSGDKFSFAIPVRITYSF